VATKIALTAAAPCTLRQYRAVRLWLLPAGGASSVDLEAVGAHLEVHASQAPEVEGTFLELGDVAAGLTDKVMVMVLGQLVTRAVAKIQPPHRPDLREEVEGTVDRH